MWYLRSKLPQYFTASWVLLCCFQSSSGNSREGTKMRNKERQESVYKSWAQAKPSLLMRENKLTSTLSMLIYTTRIWIGSWKFRRRVESGTGRKSNLLAEQQVLVASRGQEETFIPNKAQVTRSISSLSSAHFPWGPATLMRGSGFALDTQDRDRFAPNMLQGLQKD